MGWKEEMYSEVGHLLKKRRYENLDVKKIIGLESTTGWDGYCETCYHEYDAVEIIYLDSEGITQTYEYYGSMTELMREIT